MPLVLVAPAAAEDRLGFNEDVVANYAPWAHAQEAAGANSARITLSWQDIQPREPVPHKDSGIRQARFEEHQDAYEELRARGIRPVYTLAFAPNWARGSAAARACGNKPTCTYPPAPEHDDDWATFVRVAATAFPEADFEIWNEPNGIFWKGGHDPRRYAQLVTIAHDEIKAQSPSSQVIICGCSSPVNETEHDMRFDRFIDLAHEHWPQLAGSYDAFSYHLYPQSSGDNPRRSKRHYLGPKTYFAKMLKRAQSLLERRGAAGTPIWITELGYWTLPSQPFGLSEKKQARAFIQTIQRLRSSPAISGLFLHRGFDLSTVPPTNRQSGIGALRSDRRPKPAFCAMVLFNVNRYRGCRAYRIVRTRAQFNRGKVKVGWRTNGPKGRFWCRPQGRGWGPCRRGLKLPAQTKRLEVAGQSPLGNISRVFTLKIGNPIDRGPRRKTRSRVARFVLSGGPHRCRVNKRRPHRCGQSFKVRGLKPGKHRLKVGPYRYRWQVLP